MGDIPGVGEGVLWAIILCPLAAFAAIALYLRKRPRLAGYLSIAAIAASFALALFTLTDVLGAHGHAATHTHDWFRAGPLQLSLGVRADGLSAVMLVVVTSVALLVQVYSQGYMERDPGYGRYYAWMSLFAAAMLGLVLADNLFMLFVFWELVGLASYLLIGFWFHKPSAAAAAKKAFIVTRIGDLGLLAAMLLIWTRGGTFAIDEIHELVLTGALSGTTLTLFGLGLFAGAAGKSAQFPLHVWLPDAMEGPTPVSALIHAATMVVAGVYLVARLLPVFELAGDALAVVTAVGLTTALFSGAAAFAQTDIKKVLAYSTVSQLGFMFVALGAGVVSAGMFHLFTHAFFKALLFLGAGSVIIGAHHRQEMAQLGGLWRRMPVTGATFLVGSLALAGLFPLAGFWSKDEILHAVEGHSGALVFALISLASIMTAFYTTRLFIRTFLGKPRDAEAASHVRETGASMTGPLVVLAALSVFAGFVVYGGVGEALGFPGGFGEFVYLHHPETFHLDWGLAGVSTALFAIGALGAGWIYWGGRLDRATAVAEWQPKLYEMTRRAFHFDALYQAFVDRAVLGLSYVVSWFDRFAVNDTGVDGSATLTGYAGFVLKHLQTGRVPNYALAIAAGVALLVLVALAVGG